MDFHVEQVEIGLIVKYPSDNQFVWYTLTWEKTSLKVDEIVRNLNNIIRQGIITSKVVYAFFPL